MYTIFSEKLTELLLTYWMTDWPTDWAEWLIDWAERLTDNWPTHFLHHNMNRFIPFTVKSNDPNSINSPKSHLWDIFNHIGHSRDQFLNFSTCVNGGRCYYTIIGIVLDHFQPNQIIQIRSIVKKIWFLLFLAILGTFLALLGPISEFCNMCECCPVLPYNNRMNKSDDSNWIRSPKSFCNFSDFSCQRWS